MSELKSCRWDGIVGIHSLFFSVIKRERFAPIAIAFVPTRSISSLNIFDSCGLHRYFPSLSRVASGQQLNTTDMKYYLLCFFFKKKKRKKALLNIFTPALLQCSDRHNTLRAQACALARRGGAREGGKKKEPIWNGELGASSSWMRIW